jgi:hypothetical protein
MSWNLLEKGCTTASFGESDDFSQCGRVVGAVRPIEICDGSPSHVGEAVFVSTKGIDDTGCWRDASRLG